MIRQKINAVFVHVSDLEKAVHWYSRILQFKIDPNEQFHGHLYVIRMENNIDIILDSKNFISPSPSVVFMLDSEDIEQSYQFLRSQQVDMIHEEIEHFPNVSFFNFRDPDGNILMVCQQH